MDLGNSFVNVFDRAGDMDIALRSACAAASSARQPRVFWVSGPVTLAEHHTVPANVTLAFAPGAYLILRGSLTVLGPIDAGLEARFSVVGQGVLALLGPLEEIVADWWLPSATATAVEQALAALWIRYRHERLPAPIRLDGPYPLARPLRLRPPADLAGAFEVKLRGQWARSIDPKTFFAGGGSPEAPMSTLLSVEDGVVLDADHVAFDAGPDADGRQALACVSLEGSFDRSRMDSCGFRFGGSGIRASPAVQRVLDEVGDLASARGRQALLDEAIARSLMGANRLAVGHCLFDGASPQARGLDIGFGAPTALDLRDSQFVGFYGNALTMLGGSANIIACQFANQTRQVPFDPHKNADRSRVQDFLDTPETIADLHLRRWGDPSYDMVFRPYDAPIDQLVVVDQPPHVHRGQPLAGTHLTVTHCTSTSQVFLVMHPAFPYDDTYPGSATLLGVRHEPPGDDPSSVHVRRGAKPRSVMLQGCRLGGSVYVDSGSLNDVVVDLGTVFTGQSWVGFHSYPRYYPLRVIDLSTTS